MEKKQESINLEILNEVVEGLSGIENFKTKSPIKKYIRYNAGEGKFFYWDSNLKQNVDLGSSLRFIPIAFRSSLGGFVDEKFISSSEFQNNSEEVSIYADRKLLQKGTYGEMKESLRAKGIKYEKNIYAVGENNEIIKITLKGSALAGYLKILSENKIYETNLIGKAIELGKSAPMKKGVVNFFSIILTGATKLTDAQLEEIKVIDNTLKEYLDSRKTSQATAKDDEIILTPEEEKEYQKIKKEGRKQMQAEFGEDTSIDDFFGDF